MKASNSRVSHSVMSDSLRSHGPQPTRLLCPWDSPGKNTGMGCHFLLQEIFLSQGANLSLQYCRQILYHLSYREGRQKRRGMILLFYLNIETQNHCQN